MKHTFTKADRILKRPEFIQLSKVGKKLQNQCFIALFCPGQSDRTRLGITVTKKVGNAVVRNRLKRLSREYFRLNRHRITDNLDINIIVKKQTADLSANQIFLSLQDIFTRISRYTS